MKEVSKKTNKKILEGPNLTELGYNIEKEIKKANHFPYKTLLLVLLLVVIIGIITVYLLTPKITLNGSSKIEISYHDEYVEKGAKAKYFNKDLTNKIKTTSTIKKGKVGTYEVVYKVKNVFLTATKKRIVKLVDKEKPVITLDGGEDVNICPTAEFKELGYKASDDYDGDITKNVTIKKESDKWIYTVKDSSKNKTEVIRKINKVDKEKPVITLKGTETMYLGIDEEFTEPGYTASDNCSGNLTDKVKVTGTVKAKVEGTYTLKYEVEDDGGNKASVERKVIISKRTDPNSGVIKTGSIYLTFDDGPSSVTTPTILDILKEESIKATFFVTNNGPDGLIKRMYDEGHTVALHTASHTYSIVYKSDESYFNDLKIVSDRVKRITGQTSKIVRFPGGSSNTISRRYSNKIMTRLSEALLNQGYRYYDWNVDSNDAYTSKSKEAVYKCVTSNLSKSRANIVLMHDIKTWTRDALRDIIRYGKENGYTFERIDMDTHMVRQHINN